jgi:hypothetical protein
MVTIISSVMRRVPGQLCLCVAFLLCAACTFVVPLEAQTGGNVMQLGEGDQGAYTLNGTVVNSVTGEPLSRAVVQLNAEGQRATFTDHEGHFQFTGLPLLRGTLVAHKPNFFDESELRSGQSSQQSVEVGPGIPPVVINLIPAGVIAGHVNDSTGLPLEGVTLGLISSRIVNGRKQLQQRWSTSSQEEGEFRIPNLPPGSYYVVARPRWNRNLVTANGATKEEAFPTVYYPDANDLTSATSIQLTPGQRAQVEFTLRPAPVFSIAGVVTGYTFGRGVGLQFVSSSGDPISSAVRFNQETGAFQARVASGSPCIIKAHGEDPTGRPLYAEKTLNLTGNLAGIHLALIPSLSIPIIVRMEETKPQPPEENPSADHIGKRSMPLSIHLSSLDRSRPDAWSSIEGGPENPSIAIRNIEEGKYRIETMSQNNSWYVKSISYGSTDLLREDLVVVPGGLSSLEVVLSDDGATLSGSVQSDDIEGSATVLVVPERTPQAVKTVYVSGNGGFFVNDLAPGDYKVLAFDHLDGLEYTNPEVLREYSSKAAEISLQSNEKATIKVELVRIGE